jgi:hypothetical protein
MKRIPKILRCLFCKADYPPSQVHIADPVSSFGHRRTIAICYGCVALLKSQQEQQ